MNPEIERLMANEELLRKEEEEKRQQERKEKSVSDMDMAEQLGPLSRTMARNFKSKKLRIEDFDEPLEQGPSDCYIAPRKKPKFMKPSLE